MPTYPDLNSAALAFFQGLTTIPTSVSASTGSSAISASSATITAVVAATSSKQVLAANTARLGFVIYNDSNAVAHVAYGIAAATSAGGYTVQMVGGSYYEDPAPVYTGVVNALFQSATGNLSVTVKTS